MIGPIVPFQVPTSGGQILQVEPPVTKEYIETENEFIMLRLNNNLETNITHGVNHIIIVAGIAARPMREDKWTSPRWDRSISPIAETRSVQRARNGGNPQS